MHTATFSTLNIAFIAIQFLEFEWYPNYHTNLLTSYFIYINMTKYYQNKKLYSFFFYEKYTHQVKFYPKGNNFTQALCVLLVVNITSVGWYPKYYF